ncbi:S24/S26 family peptidase [Sphingobacterium sp. ML3W]|uniref:S24/S26 family peptidase n=1 Tax=Sphingobacterium sp. ML3W TaxID=1538644 RepID=UPI00249BBFA3|nr:S24/S26 family peptidase [Sphingobacterium sp. ML3W]WFA78220.1 S24/S26 family peptidase [Sphingobacterium sp. ML3W]
MAEHSEDNKTRVISNALYFAEVQRMLDEGKEVRIRIKGGSMRPFIHDGDSVLLQTYRGESLQLGSNVLAKYEGKFVFHRYVGKKNGQIVLAGDGNLVLREYINSTDIIAIASIHFPQNSALEISLNHSWARLRGLGWYHIRLLRRVIAKLRRLITR